MIRPEFATFDAEIARRMEADDLLGSGLPAYLGIRTVGVAAGAMTAELDVRPTC
ncbi:hypothetical protein BH24ACT3_BH24ACT3_19520 [soil metagenome]